MDCQRKPAHERGNTMQRTPINPVEWGLAFQMNQGEVIEGAARHLRCSGQVDLHDDPDSEMGIGMQCPNDMPGQIRIALANIDTILQAAGMERANIVSLRFYTTDVDAFLENYGIYADWIAPAGIRPPQSLLGVARLALAGLVVEIECEAAA